ERGWEAPIALGIVLLSRSTAKADEPGALCSNRIARLLSADRHERCLVPLRDPTLANEMRAHQSKTTCVAANANSWRVFVQLPARRLVSARDALQEHTIRLELQQSIMAAKAAVGLSQPPAHARRVAIPRLKIGRASCRESV